MKKRKKKVLGTEKGGHKLITRAHNFHLNKYFQKQMKF